MHVTYDLAVAAMVSIFVGAAVGAALGILIPPPRWFVRIANRVFDRLGA